MDRTNLSPFHPFNDLLEDAAEVSEARVGGNFRLVKPLGHVEDYLLDLVEYLASALPEEIRPKAVPKAVGRGTFEARLVLLNIGWITAKWDNSSPILVHIFIRGEGDYSTKLCWEDAPQGIALDFADKWQLRSIRPMFRE